MRPLVQVLLCASLPVAALGELALAQAQARKVPSDAEWRAAAAAAKAAKRPGDVVVVAPAWAGPLGRKAVGEVDASMIDLSTVAKSDLQTARRVLELSIRGHDDPDVKGFKLVSEQAFGPVKLRTFENPKPDTLVRDLVSELGPAVQVAHVRAVLGAEACRWERGASRIPNLFTGPATPLERFSCPPHDPSWTFVGVTAITDLAYVPRRCILMHPTENARTTVTYPPAAIGKKVVAYVGIHVFQERDLNKAPVHARVSVAGQEVAHALHKDGDGWLRFEGSTAQWAGQNQEVKLETWAEGSAQFRVACVAAQLRD
jgi:hypothetical protein